MKRTALLFVFAVALALAAFSGFYSGVAAEPTPGTQVHLPILTWLGDEADACEVVIEVQNVGADFTKAMIFFWGAPSACPPQCQGPFKVECSGLLKPGSTWNFIGPNGSAQVPPGAKKGIVFSLSNEQVDGDIFADAVCEEAFANRGDCDDYRRFKKAFDEGLEWEGFDFGKYKGEPLAVEVVRKCQSVDLGVDQPIVSAYSGIAGPMLGAADPVFGGGQSGYMFYAPLLYADQRNLNSWIYIQNAGLECTSVEIWLKQQGECIRATIDEIAALAPGQTIQYDVSELMGPFWQGNAWIRTSVPAAIVVDNWSPDVLMTYHGKPAELNYTFDPNRAFFTQGSQVNYAPLIYREHQGWNTNIQVQNLSSVVNAKVKVYFLDNSGDIIKTVVDWICPRGTQTFPLAVIDGLAGNWVGQARVESQEWWSPGDPKVLPPNLVSVAELIRYEGPAQANLLEGVAYNLFPEQQAFDWQIGRGKGGLESGVGLIGIPSFLNQLNDTSPRTLGLSTELAIANLVPKPGKTDFAIYIYDQNGLLDYVCEALNEKQVEYINVANDWNYINVGFKGSAVISAVWWEHPVHEFYPRNLVGLAAVKIERFGWPQQPNPDPIDDFPGDQASASEGFPIYGPWNYGDFDGFDFEGPQAPACPGVGEHVCYTNVNVRIVKKNGGVEPLANAAVQLRRDGVPVSTAVTDANGFAEFTRVPLQPYDPNDPENSPTREARFEVWYFEGGSGIPTGAEWKQAAQDLWIPPQEYCRPSIEIEWPILAEATATLSGFAMESCWIEADDIAKLSGATVELWLAEDSPDGDPLETTTTNSQGYWEFEDVDIEPGWWRDSGTDFIVKICFLDGNGNTVCFETDPVRVNLKNKHWIKFWFHYDSVIPDHSFWCGSRGADIQIGGYVFDQDDDEDEAEQFFSPQDEDLTALAGVDVRLYDAGPGDDCDDPNDELVTVKSTNSDGWFLFNGLDQGYYCLEVEDDRTPFAIESDFDQFDFNRVDYNHSRELWTELDDLNP